MHLSMFLVGTTQKKIGHQSILADTIQKIAFGGENISLIGGIFCHQNL